MIKTLFVLLFAMVSAVFLALAAIKREATDKTEAVGKEYKVILCMTAKGSDGTVAVSREVKLPFVPRVGVDIDLFVTEHVSWSTKRGAFIVRLRPISETTMKARQFMRIMSLGDKWEETFFYESKR